MTRNCLLALVCFAGPISAAERPSVQVTVFDGPVVHGVLAEPTLRFQFAGGTAEFVPEKVKTISFGQDIDSITVEGFDQALRGKCLNPEIKIEIGQSLRSFKRGELKAIKITHGGQTNWLTGVIIPLITLTAMEIVLGIDNIIFLAIVAGRLPKQQQPQARRLGLFAALGTRLLLLATLSLVLGLTWPVVTLPDFPFFHEMEARQLSWRDIILLAGGMFLIGKSTFEIHEKLERPNEEERHDTAKSAASFGWVLMQIAVIDIVFSLDSVVTAVGMAESIWVMITAMLVAVGVMLVFAETISQFVARNPTLKILALAFLILIGVLLVAEGFGQHIEKGYVYFAMAFAVGVEVVNLRVRKKTDPVRLRDAEPPLGLS